MQIYKGSPFSEYFQSLPLYSIAKMTKILIYVIVLTFYCQTLCHGKTQTGVVKYPGQVVFLGDSITHFWQQNGWQPWAEFYAPVGSVNTGWPGDWTSTLIDKINQGLIDQYSPRVAVLLIGTNDLGQGGDEQSVVANIATIIQLVQAKSPGVKILLLGILPRVGVDVHAKIQRVNAELELKYAGTRNRASASDIYFLNMESSFSSQLGTLLPGMSEDGVHLSALGYNTWAAEMNPLFFALLDGNSTTTTTTTIPSTTTTQGPIPDCTNAVFFGDSITDFFDSDGLDTWNEFYGPLGAKNFGQSGDWTYDTINKIVDAGYLDGLKVRVAVLKIGTNDLSGNKDEIVVAGNIRIIVDLIKDRTPGVHVLLLGILPRDGAEVHGRVRKLNELISKLALEENVHYFDMQDQFSTGLGSVIPGLFTDGLHLSPRGYQVWAETMNPLFFSLLETPYC